jgi:hypothetical protein
MVRENVEISALLIGELINHFILGFLLKGES